MKVLVLVPQSLNISRFENLLDLSSIRYTLVVQENVKLLHLIQSQHPVIHWIISEDHLLSIKEISFLVLCHLLGKSIVLSLTTPLTQKQKIQFEVLNFIDAITFHDLKSRKEAHGFKATKSIFNLFDQNIFNKPQQNAFKFLKNYSLNPKSAFIFSIEENFEELKIFKSELFLGSSQKLQIVIDAHLMKAQSTRSEIVKKWKKFIQKNNQFKECLLISEPTSLVQIIENSNQTLYWTYHHKNLKFNLNSFLYKLCEYRLIFVINEYQASVFSHFWQDQKNCRILSHQLSEIKLITKLKKLIESFSHPRDSSPFESLQLDDSVLQKTLQLATDEQMNELTRLYRRCENQKSTFLNPKSVKVDT